MAVQGGRRGGGWRVVRRVALVLLAIVALVVGALLTGVPQERAIEYFASNALGAIVEVDYGHAITWVYMERIAIYASDADRESGDPLIDIVDLELRYDPFPDDGRYLRQVTAQSIGVFADARDPENPNYAFLLEGGPTDSASPDARFLPVEMSCTRIDVRYRSNEFNADLENVPVHARFDDDGTLRTATGTAITRFRWWTDDPDDAMLMDGLNIADAEVSAGADAVSWDGAIFWGDRAAAGSSGRIDLSSEPSVVTVDDGAFAAGGETLTDWARRFGLNVTARRLMVEGVEGTYTFGEAATYEGEATIQLYSPQILGGDYLYGGRALINVHVSGGRDSLAGNGQVELARGQTVDLEVRVGGDSGTTEVTVSDWSKDDLLDAIPASFRESVEPLGFDRFSSEAKAEWTSDGFDVTLRGGSEGEVDAAPAISWAIDASGPMDGSRPVEGQLEARLGESLIQAAGFYDEAGGYSGEAIAEEVELRPWLAFFIGPDDAASVRGTIEGTMSAKAVDLDAPMTITPKVTLREAGYEEVRVDEVTMAGELVYDRLAEALRIASLRAETVDGLTSIALSDWDYSLANATGGGAYEAGADLGLVSRLLDLPEMYGAATVDGDVRAEGGAWSATMAIFSDFMGYEDLLFTLGGDVTGGGTIEFDPDSGVSLDELAIRVGEGTTARLRNVRVAMDPVVAQGDLSAESDLDVLIGMGYLQEVEGTFREASTFRYDDQGLWFDWNVNMELARLILMEEAGFAEGLKLTGSGTYRDGLEGTGDLRATLLSAAGGSIRDVLGPAVFSGSQMRIAGATGTIFDGLIVADLDIGLLETGVPVFLRSEFTDIDLHALSEEVQPPNTNLTGFASGTLSAEAKDGEVIGFELDARSDRGLSVNRSLVADLLTSEGFLAGAGERLAGRTMDKILGEAPQRPFDSARLYMYLAADKLAGTAELRSQQTNAYRGLNLNVSLDVDAGSLADALLLLEQAKLDSMEF